MMGLTWSIVQVAVFMHLGLTTVGLMKNELRLLPHEDFKTQSTSNVFESFNW